MTAQLAPDPAYWRGVVGTIYLLHFEEPYRHAQHYLGWTRRLTSRLDEHRLGQGSRLVSAVNDAGISWTVAGTWTGDRHMERRMKNCGGLARCCPTCGGTLYYTLRNEEAAPNGLA